MLGQPDGSIWVSFTAPAALGQPMHFRDFDEAYVVSDLHLGGPPGFQMFDSAKRFQEFIEHLVRRLKDLRKQKSSAELLLVINGDFVDFLAESGDYRRGGKRYFLTEKADETLKRILLQKNRCLAVTEALRKFVSKPGSNLVVVLGNHDLELSLPDCREAFLEIMTSGDRRRRSRIELRLEGWGYRFRVNGKRALCLHGNETDTYNFTRYDELDRIQRDMQLHGHSEFGDEWIPSAGTQFVINAVNPLKSAHPFVDLMHPLIPLVPAVLGTLDPSNVRFADEAAEMAIRAQVNDATRPASQRRMLSTDLLAMPGQDRAQDRSASELFDEVERALAGGRIDELIAESAGGNREVLAWGWVESLRNSVRRFRDTTVDLTKTAVHLLDAGKRIAHREFVRRSLSLVVDEQLDCPLELSKDDTAIERTIRADYDVIFVGHTHHRRLAMRSSGKGIHVNTGTWADRMTLLKSDVNDARRFERIYATLIDSKRSNLTDPRLGLVRRDCTVAVMGTQKTGVSVSIGSVPDGNPAKFDCEYVHHSDSGSVERCND